MAEQKDPPGSALPIDKAVVVIGAGTMGSGIAEVAACAGHRVFLRDTSAAALDRGMTQIGHSLDKRVERGRLEASQRDAIFARLRPVNAEVKLSGVGLVIEVIVENLDIKVAVLSQIEAEVESDTIIATNTSSLSITAIAGRLSRPDRVVGMHFFNPATVLPLVEVVGGAATAPDVTRTFCETAKAWGKVPVVCRSTPGFIVNRVARPYYGEALRLLQEQATTPATLDAVMRECGGFKMGPCELMDLIGHDVNFAVTKSVYEGFFDDPRYKPSLVQKDLVDAGWLGRKSGRGFFDHREGAAAATPEDVGSRASVPSTVRIEGDLGPAALLGSMLLRQDETEVARRDGAGLLRVDGFAVALSDGRTATERSVALGEPVVLFDLALDYAACSRVLLAPAAQASDLHLAKAIGLFVLLRKKVSLAADVPGLAVTRTVAMLVNKPPMRSNKHCLCRRCGRCHAEGRTIPSGRWLGDARRVWPHHHGVAHLAQTYGEDRYRTSPWLQRAVHATQALGASRGSTGARREARKGRRCHDRPSGATQCPQLASEERDRPASEHPEPGCRRGRRRCDGRGGLFRSWHRYR
jgi:3-hydroxybutyryl-CoA dehydrogenase